MTNSTVVIPHSKIWDKRIFNANDGKKIIGACYDVGMTSPFLQIRKPVFEGADQQYDDGLTYFVKNDTDIESFPK